MGLVHCIFADTGHWEFRVKSGEDVGTDCELELIEDERYTGFTFNCQVKSTKNIESYWKKYKASFSISIKISTINYWLNKSNPFLLLLADVIQKDIYYVVVQDYLSGLDGIDKKLMSNQEKLTIAISATSKFDNVQLTKLVKNLYKGMIKIR